MSCGHVCLSCVSTRERTDQAISELRDTYERFDEGFTTEDLVAAHALIEAPTMQ